MYALVRCDSTLFALALELYVGHHPASDGRCIRCRVPGCEVRAQAANVLVAAGVDPSLYDPPPRRPWASPWAQAATLALPVYQGGERS